MEEGSKLSPPLFGVVIAELILLLQTKHASATTYSASGNTWVGTIAHVDDMVLISKNPDELKTCSTHAKNGSGNPDWKSTQIKPRSYTFINQSPPQISHV